MRTLHVVCSFVLSLLVEGSAIAQIGEPTPVPAGKSAEQEPMPPPLPGRLQRHNPTMALTPGGGDDKQDYSRCISDWDSATHMTKQEWRAACRRALSDYPGAFRY